MPKKFLTVNEVANIFGVTPLTVRNWDKKGALV
ncbi:MAG: MerR family transcriptional regulator, partial [Candidatus Yanofskybacteria bacterium]|nr:MerR family transcriptional regulator [Candidatus Yanofskybacteria bacterium]